MAVSRNQRQTNARKRARPGSRSQTQGRARGSKRRWLVLPLALGIAGLALYVLSAGGQLEFLDPGEPPLDDIGDVSRLRLEKVLSEAERDPQGRP